MGPSIHRTITCGGRGDRDSPRRGVGGGFTRSISGFVFFKTMSPILDAYRHLNAHLQFIKRATVFILTALQHLLKLYFSVDM